MSLFTLPPLRFAIVTVLLAAGCEGGESPTGTPRAFVLDAESVNEIGLNGVTVSGRPGDVLMRNPATSFVIQGPVRNLAIGPYGGSVVDVGRAGGNDLLGEVIPVLGLGRTVKANTVTVLQDGSDGDAVVEVHGIDATNVYLNVEALAPGLVSYNADGSGLLSHDPEAPWHLDVTARYTLPRGEPRLSIKYTFTNTGDETAMIPLGFLLDTQANVETYSPGTGFELALQKSFDAANIMGLLGFNKTTPMTVVFDANGAVAAVPRRVQDKTPPRVIAFNIPTIGAGLVLETSSAIGAAGEPSLIINPGDSAEVELDLVVAPTPAEALAVGWRLLGQSLGRISGCVTAGGEPAASVRVGVEEATAGPTSVFTTGEEGCFSGEVPPGSYTLVAGMPLRPLGEPMAVEVAAGGEADVQLTLPALGTLDVAVSVYNKVHEATPSFHPCRITLVGESAMAQHPLLGVTPDDAPHAPISRMWLSRSCVESLAVAPGRYLAYVTRGPEFTRIEQLIDVTAGQATPLQGSLHRVVDSEGYAASDFHVHSIYSTDSRVPVRERTLSLAAEGMDFWVSLEHDTVADYTPHIAELGLSAELLTAPGAEVTSFELGHFGAYPLVVDKTQANGGAPDWGMRDDGTRPTFDELFDGIHARGAMVQVNHPRSSSDMAIGAYFTRGGLRFDPDSLQPLADPNLQPVPNDLLRYPTGLEFFSTHFDVIEVMNGIGTKVQDGLVIDKAWAYGGEDWMSLLSSGKRLAGTANSDTHDLRGPPGEPRTMVGGHQQGASGILGALAQGNAFMTSGPHVTVELLDAGGESAGLGEMLVPTASTLTLRVRVQTPDWYQVDVVDALANVFVPLPPHTGPLPTVTPPTALTPEPVLRANGGTAWVAEEDLLLDLSQIPNGHRDTWVVVRVGGTQSNLFPVMTSGGGTLDTSAQTPEAFFSSRHGIHAYAMTNPIYIDVDGDGVWTGSVD